jgi:group II intron reverse transcriptase/maturase
VDGDLKDFFGSVDHEKLLTLIAQRVADSRVLRLIKAMLKAGSYGQGKLFPSERGTPQGGVASPLLSNILLTPFDQEMRRKGYQLTRFADDWVITCKSAAEARAALAAATRILERLGVCLNPQKTRIMHIQQGFDFLGYRMVRTSGNSKIPRGMIQRWNPKGLIAYPTRKSIRRFRDRVRILTRRSAQRKTAELIHELNRLCEVGLSITNEPTSERSSTNLTAGSCGAFGRTVSAGGGPGVGSSYPRRSCMKSLAW